MTPAARLFLRLISLVALLTLAGCPARPYTETIAPKAALSTFHRTVIVVIPGDLSGVTNMQKSMDMFARVLSERLKKDGTIADVATGPGLTADLYIVAEIKKLDRDSDLANKVANGSSIATGEVEVKLVDAAKQLIGQFSVYGNSRDYNNSLWQAESFENASDQALFMAAGNAADYLKQRR